ncbi:MAG: LysR family transcriptional regulator [Variovorax sp.]|nr:MAG: LysR family transcriptional regulator [Variovorax sp.]
MGRPPFRVQHMPLLQAVMQSQTITEAANRLHVSQPAVSKQLKQLQTDLGFTLFERQGHKLIPTFEARAMLDQVNRVNASLDVLNRIAIDFRSARRGHLQIACIPAVAGYLLPASLIKTVGSEAGLMTTVHTGNSAQVVEWVETQQVDIGIALRIQGAEDLGFQSLLEWRLECLLPGSHPLARLKTLRPKDLANYPVVGVELPAAVLPEPGVPRWDSELGAVRIRVDSSHIACQFAMAGLGIAVADSLTIAGSLRKPMARRRLEPAARSDIGIYRPRYRPKSEALEALIKELKSQARTLEPVRSGV